MYNEERETLSYISCRLFICSKEQRQSLKTRFQSKNPIYLPSISVVSTVHKVAVTKFATISLLHNKKKGFYLTEKRNFSMALITRNKHSVARNSIQIRNFNSLSISDVSTLSTSIVTKLGFYLAEKRNFSMTLVARNKHSIIGNSIQIRNLSSLSFDLGCTYFTHISRYCTIRKRDLSNGNKNCLL